MEPLFVFINYVYIQWIVIKMKRRIGDVWMKIVEGTLL